MRDPRVHTLARNLIRYSVDLQPGERILIEVYDDGRPLVEALVREAYEVGGRPFVSIKDQTVQAALLSGASGEHFDEIARHEASLMQQVKAYIGIRGYRNPAELSGVPDEQMRLYQTRWWEPVHSRIRVPDTKWCVLRWPNPAMAASAGMSTEAFTDFYFDVCCLDYAKMSRAMDALVTRMERADRVHIKGPGTDLRFSIKAIPKIKCDGHRNIPDGEVYTAPVRDSVNGVVSFNTPSIYQGHTFENVRLEFKDGRVVQATASDTERINRILDTDAGARYVGEFAIGFNPYILQPMKDTLFDEKIAGSFHFTPGNAYTIADNGNRSAIHWDLVCIQRREWGGGEIWFDDELIRQDGQFVPEELQPLNPERLAPPAGESSGRV